MKHIYIILLVSLCLVNKVYAVNETEVRQTANYRVIPLPQEIIPIQDSPFLLEAGVTILYPSKQ